MYEYSESKIESMARDVEVRIMQALKFGVTENLDFSVYVMPDPNLSALLVEHGAARLQMRVTGFIRGLENKVEEVEKSRKTVKSSTVTATEHVPVTWWDAVKQTFALWLRERSRASYPTRTWFQWRLLDWSYVIGERCNLRTIEIRHHQTDEVEVTVVKHWHVCPHLKSASPGQHVRFLADPKTEYKTI